MQSTHQLPSFLRVKADPRLDISEEGFPQVPANLDTFPAEEQDKIMLNITLVARQIKHFFRARKDPMYNALWNESAPEETVPLLCRYNQTWFHGLRHLRMVLTVLESRWPQDFPDTPWAAPKLTNEEMLEIAHDEHTTRQETYDEAVEYLHQELE
ncbi:hypothetical protein DXG03_005265, partial [Asterophora parasitica]